MTSEPIQETSPSEVLLWLEDEIRETKLQVSRIEQNLSAAQAQLAELAPQVHAIEAAAATVPARLAEIPQVAGQIAQVRQAATQIEEQAAASDRRLSEAVRLQQIETERLRQELSGTYRRIELVERLVGTWGPRFERLEEADRRLQEVVTAARQRSEELERRQESAELRMTRGFETSRRYEHDIARLEAEIEALHKQDAVVFERSQSLVEAIRRVEQQSEAVAAETASQRSVFEKIELLRAEIRRVEDRIAVSETQCEQQQQDSTEQRRLISLLDGKDRGFAERLVLLQEDLLAHREQVAEQFHRIHLGLERHRRRQIEELERDLRELKVMTFRAPEDGADDGRSRPVGEAGGIERRS